MRKTKSWLCMVLVVLVGCTASTMKNFEVGANKVVDVARAGKLKVTIRGRTTGEWRFGFEEGVYGGAPGSYMEWILEGNFLDEKDTSGISFLVPLLPGEPTRDIGTGTGDSGLLDFQGSGD